jgi:hypothetical protein
MAAQVIDLAFLGGVTRTLDRAPAPGQRGCFPGGSAIASAPAP